MSTQIVEAIRIADFELEAMPRLEKIRKIRNLLNHIYMHGVSSIDIVFEKDNGNAQLSLKSEGIDRYLFSIARESITEALIEAIHNQFPQDGKADD